MTASLILFHFGELPRPQRRLAVGLGLSLLAHGLLVAGVRPMTADPILFRPLQVQLQAVAREPDPALLATPAPAPDAVMAPAGSPPVEASEFPKPARPVAGAVAGRSTDPRLPLDRYFTSNEVDVRAEPLNDPPLIYPDHAYRMRVRGKVVLRILIDERGNVDDVSVLESRPPQVFDGAALDAARALQFSPALRHGRAVKTQKTVEVVLDPYESIHIP